MTDKELTERMNARLNECPACGCSDLTAHDYGGGRVLSCRVTCRKCHATWPELYRFEQACDFEEG